MDYRSGIRIVAFILFAASALLSSSCKKEIDQGSELRILLWESPLSVNPNRDFDSLTDSVLFNVFEPLVGLDAELHLKPVLAVSWENPKPEIWRFHLRKGVSFHDGTLLTSQTVREALLEVKGSDWETSAFLTPIKQIVCVDPQTIDLVTEKPFAILSKLTFVHIFKKNNGFPSFLGTGPFSIIEWNPKKQIRLKAFDRYWGARTDFAMVRFLPVDDAKQRLDMLSDGRADIAYFIPARLSSIQRKGVQFTFHTGLAVYYLGFNLRKKTDNPFQDVRVRKAIHIAINRNEIVADALRGRGYVPTQLVSPFIFGYNPDIPQPEFDVEKARALLSEAGYLHGFQTHLDFGDSRLRVAELIEKDLQQIGIRVELDIQSRNDVYEVAEQGKSDFFLVGWDCSSGDASEFYEFNLHTQSGGFGLGNYGGYSSPELDTICETHSQIMDDRGRKELLQKAGAITMRDLPVIPLFIEDDIYALKDSLYFQPRADGQIQVLDVKRR